MKKTELKNLIKEIIKEETKSNPYGYGVNNLNILKNTVKKINPNLSIEVVRFNGSQYNLVDKNNKTEFSLYSYTDPSWLPISRMSGEDFDKVVDTFKEIATAYTNKTGYFSEEIIKENSVLDQLSDDERLFIQEYENPVLRKFMSSKEISTANKLVRLGIMEKGISDDKQHSVIYYTNSHYI